eukprot:CAMPEP_0168778514 /NCGR_PEP_ID=MMETSP0725-20121227/7123_1 /TAXON_ID=265536 /ORGANISM="Amphiprora sp., Strain CCMP467" /LENGTH=287 /DNA_ID=CAMNT_0008828289 /DNA_START=26 /DNA_END=889 /DNA_ORIENTATION=-
MKIVFCAAALMATSAQGFSVQTLTSSREGRTTALNNYSVTKWSPQGGASAGSWSVTMDYDPAATMTQSFSSETPATASPAPAVAPVAVGSPMEELSQRWSDQVSVELAASQLYLSASIWFRERQMKGMAAWMLDESGEERGHGLAILEFAMQRQFPVTLKALDAPQADWETPTQVWESILNAEQTNTQNLLQLAEVADQCGEYGAMAFLNPFHVEQIEAEDKVGAIVAQVQTATPEFLMELDLQLGLEAEEEEEEGHGPAPAVPAPQAAAVAGGVLSAHQRWKAFPN